MRRYLYLILFLLVLVLPFLMRIAVIGGAPASGGGKTERLVIVTSHNQDIRRAFERAFNQWSLKRSGPAVGIDYRIPGGSNDVKRLLENPYDGYRDKQGKLPADMPADIDMVWG